MIPENKKEIDKYFEKKNENVLSKYLSMVYIII
jgi:hypothetical protein